MAYESMTLLVEKALERWRVAEKKRKRYMSGEKIWKRKVAHKFPRFLSLEFESKIGTIRLPSQPASTLL